MKNPSVEMCNSRKVRENPAEPGLRIVFAGGGTGGHLFPAIAIAEEFECRHAGNRILFMSSGRPIEENVLSKTGYEKAAIRVEGIKGRSLWSKLTSLFILPRALFRAIGILVGFKPDVVVGMGGYSAGPVILAAWMLKIPRVICEQNKLPGVTNKLLSRFSNRIFAHYQDTALKASADKLRVFGNPVRKDIIKKLQQSSGKQEGAIDRKFTVLILGGSQGAHGINMAIIEAVSSLNDPGKYYFIHQSGAADEDVVRKAYQEKNISHTVAPFFDDMASLYQNADLVICRSGATTVAEVTIAGCAVIFVPFPQAADNHQVFNAKALVDDGAAEMILEKDLSGNVLSGKIEFYAGHPDIIEEMKRKIRKFGNPDAAERIVDDIYSLLESKGRQTPCAA